MSPDTQPTAAMTTPSDAARKAARKLLDDHPHYWPQMDNIAAAFDAFAAAARAEGEQEAARLAGVVRERAIEPLWACTNDHGATSAEYMQCGHMLHRAFRCRLCEGFGWWLEGDPEYHADGCPAALTAQPASKGLERYTVDDPYCND